jgi:hypothetical protein
VVVVVQAPSTQVVQAAAQEKQVDLEVAVQPRTAHQVYRYKADFVLLDKVIQAVKDGQ